MANFSSTFHNPFSRLRTDQNFNYTYNTQNGSRKALANFIESKLQPYQNDEKSKITSFVPPQASLVNQILAFSGRFNPKYHSYGIILLHSVEFFIAMCLLVPKILINLFIVLLPLKFIVWIYCFNLPEEKLGFRYSKEGLLDPDSPTTETSTISSGGDEKMCLKIENSPKKYVKDPSPDASVFENCLWRRILLHIGVCLWRIGAFTMGLNYIKITGKPDKRALIKIFYPHTSVLDSNAVNPFLPHPSFNSFVLKSTVGSVLDTRPLLTIPVDRKDPNIRKNVSDEIKYRATHPQEGWFPVLIAPEGTAMNGTAILPFKLGAFTPGQPVQPIQIKLGRQYEMYKSQMSIADISNQKTPNFILFWIYLFSYLHIPCEIIYHPTYFPSPQEIKNPKLFAQNVRNLCSQQSNLSQLDTCYEDGLLMIKFYQKYRGDPNFGLVKFHKLKNLYHLDFKSVEKYFEFYLDNFMEFMINQKQGVIASEIFFEKFNDISSKRSQNNRNAEIGENSKINIDTITENFTDQIIDDSGLHRLEVILGPIPDFLYISDVIEILCLLDKNLGV